MERPAGQADGRETLIPHPAPCFLHPDTAVWVLLPLQHWYLFGIGGRVDWSYADQMRSLILLMQSASLPSLREHPVQIVYGSLRG